MRLHELVEDVDEQPEPTRINGNGDNGDNGDNGEVDYDRVFHAVAKHFDCDPDNIDEEDEETKKKVYDMMDKCWDSEENKVPDSCPIDVVPGPEHEDGEEDENGDGDDEDDDTFEF